MKKVLILILSLLLLVGCSKETEVRRYEASLDNIEISYDVTSDKYTVYLINEDRYLSVKTFKVALSNDNDITVIEYNTGKAEIIFELNPDEYDNLGE